MVYIPVYALKLQKIAAFLYDNQSMNSREGMLKVKFHEKFVRSNRDGLLIVLLKVKMQYLSPPVCTRR